MQIEKTFETTAAPRIVVRNSSGQVVVKGWEKRQVHVTCAMFGTNAELEVEQFPERGPTERVRLAVVQPAVTGQQRTANLTVETPLESSVEVRNPEGNVLISRLGGDVSVDTTNASISVIEVAEHTGFARYPATF